MNRQEAKLLGFSKEARKAEYSGNYIHLDNVIDIVYDGFESRVCENCKFHYRKNGCGLEKEWNLIVKDKGEYGYRLKKFDTPFDCNKHEPKET